MRLRISCVLVLCLGGQAIAQSSVQPTPNKPSIDTGTSASRPAPAPKPANDLDTLQIASANRQRAASIQEKTNGLWQSWTTSICEGCGDTPNYKETVRANFEKRKDLADFGYADDAHSQSQAAAAKLSVEEYGRRLYTDLSSRNISQIRQMPRQAAPAARQRAVALLPRPALRATPPVRVSRGRDESEIRTPRPDEAGALPVQP